MEGFKRRECWGYIRKRKENISFRPGHLLLGGRDQQGKCFIMQIASSYGEWRGST